VVSGDMGVEMNEVIVPEMVERGMVCNGCGMPIVNYGYCTPHEEDCPNHSPDDDELMDCECDLHYHSRCCPECNDLRVLVTSYQLGGRE
jgi:hypothetical protein